MNLLLDECVPKRLKRHFAAEGHTCFTVSEAGFVGKTNGEDLRLAQRKFQVLITLDKDMPFQQNLSGINIAILLIRASSNRVADILPCVPDCLLSLRSIKRGEILTVGADR